MAINLISPDSESTEEDIGELLSSDVRIGDIDLLERHLSSVSSPEKFLNQVYDEEYSQKCTLLTIACVYGHDDIMRILINRYKPNLEIKNDILFGDDHTDQQMCYSVTVLWVAAVTNNLEMVKLLVEHGADINHTTKTNSTALRSACYNGNVEMARYLIEKGADVNIAKENNDTNLAVSVYRKHLHMATYLVDEIGGDVNVCDNDGRSPLYDAVNCNSLELVKFLLDRGARNFRASIDDMSPLMWAAEKRKVDIMNEISVNCSIIEKIEAEELLASAYVCGDVEDRDIEQAIQHYTQAFQLRLIHNIPKSLTTKTNSLFNNRQECQTIEELNNLNSDSNEFEIEGLIVRERLLGPKNSEYRYSLRYHGALLADDEQHDQAISFWMYELKLRQEYSIPIDSENLRYFASMFSEMIFLSLSIRVEALVTVIKVIMNELKSNKTKVDFNLQTLLFLITITSQFTQIMNISITDRREIYRCLCSIVQCKYVTNTDGLSLLHSSLMDTTSADEFFIDRTCQYPCLTTVRTLLECGADVNATDNNGNTPLHKLASNWSLVDENILDLLFSYGAHWDRVNIFRDTAVDVASTPIVKQLIKSRTKIRLKCLCAKMIQNNHISFHGKITNSLAQFVEEH